ncbi:hypothetical protein P7K49_022865, partial [Saguinus oedipus]
SPNPYPGRGKFNGGCEGSRESPLLPTPHKMGSIPCAPTIQGRPGSSPPPPLGPRLELRRDMGTSQEWAAVALR